MKTLMRLRSFILLATLVGCSNSAPVSQPLPPVVPPPVVNPALNTATLQWSAPTMNTDGTTPVTTLSGYRIYYGTDPADMSQTIEVPATSSEYEITGFTDGQWYFGITALAADGTESSMSNVGSKEMVN